MLLFFSYLNAFCCWANWGIFLPATLQTIQFGRCCTCHCCVSPHKSRELHWCKCPCWSASATSVSFAVCAGIHQPSPCFTTDDVETPGIANSGHSLSSTDLRHLFLKHPTPTSGGKKIATTMQVLELYCSMRKSRRVFLCTCMHEDHIFYQEQQSMIEVHCALVKRSLDIWNSNYLYLFTIPYDTPGKRVLFYHAF